MRNQEIPKICKVCKKETKIVRTGKRNKKPAFLCKSCEHVFVLGDDRKGRKIKNRKSFKKEVLVETSRLLRLRREYFKLEQKFSRNISLKKIDKIHNELDSLREQMSISYYPSFKDIYKVLKNKFPTEKTPKVSFLCKMYNKKE